MPERNGRPERGLGYAHARVERERRRIVHPHRERRPRRTAAGHGQRDRSRRSTTHRSSRPDRIKPAFAERRRADGGGLGDGMSAGLADESTQALDFIVTNTNNAIFSVQPAVQPNGTLTYTPMPGTSGSATVSVQNSRQRRDVEWRRGHQRCADVTITCRWLRRFHRSSRSPFPPDNVKHQHVDERERDIQRHGAHAYSDVDVG